VGVLVTPLTEAQSSFVEESAPVSTFIMLYRPHSDIHMGHLNKWWTAAVCPPKQWLNKVIEDGDYYAVICAFAQGRSQRSCIYCCSISN